MYRREIRWRRYGRRRRDRGCRCRSSSISCSDRRADFLGHGCRSSRCAFLGIGDRRVSILGVGLGDLWSDCLVHS